MNDVLDAMLFLVLVSAAVGTLTLPGHGQEAESADDIAAVLTTATGGVAYRLPPHEGRVATTGERGAIRTAGGTHAQLLAAAAMRDIAVSGGEVTTADDGFERAVIDLVANATRGGKPVAVDATWAPYPGAPVRGHVHAGPEPPRTAAVWAVSVPVSAGTPSRSGRITGAAERDGYAGVARVIARGTVRRVFPPRATAVALRDDGPVAGYTVTRYRGFARLVNTSVAESVEATAPRRANARLARALAPRIERDLRRSYDTPSDAARSVSLASVRVTVRTWSR